MISCILLIYNTSLLIYSTHFLNRREFIQSVKVGFIPVLEFFPIFGDKSDQFYLYEYFVYH